MFVSAQARQSLPQRAQTHFRLCEAMSSLVQPPCGTSQEGAWITEPCGLFHPEFSSSPVRTFLTGTGQCLALLPLTQACILLHKQSRWSQWGSSWSRHQIGAVISELLQENETTFKNCCRVGAQQKQALIIHTICKINLIKTMYVCAFTSPAEI